MFPCWKFFYQILTNHVGINYHYVQLMIKKQHLGNLSEYRTNISPNVIFLSLYTPMLHLQEREIRFEIQMVLSIFSAYVFKTNYRKSIGCELGRPSCTPINHFSELFECLFLLVRMSYLCHKSIKGMPLWSFTPWNCAFCLSFIHKNIV